MSIEDEIRERIVVGGGIGHIREPELDLLLTPDWRPIAEAPIPPHNPARSWEYYPFLLQLVSGHVCEGYAQWRRPSGRNSAPTPVLKWRNRLGAVTPEFFMPLPKKKD